MTQYDKNNQKLSYTAGGTWDDERIRQFYREAERNNYISSLKPSGPELGRWADKNEFLRDNPRASGCCDCCDCCGCPNSCTACCKCCVDPQQWLRCCDTATQVCVLCHPCTECLGGIVRGAYLCITCEPCVICYAGLKFCWCLFCEDE